MCVTFLEVIVMDDIEELKDSGALPRLHVGFLNMGCGPAWHVSISAFGFQACGPFRPPSELTDPEAWKQTNEMS